jgi:hypothetical protein
MTGTGAQQEMNVGPVKCEMEKPTGSVGFPFGPGSISWVPSRPRCRLPHPLLHNFHPFTILPRNGAGLPAPAMGFHGGLRVALARAAGAGGALRLLVFPGRIYEIAFRIAIMMADPA